MFISYFCSKSLIWVPVSFPSLLVPCMFCFISLCVAFISSFIFNWTQLILWAFWLPVFWTLHLTGWLSIFPAYRVFGKAALFVFKASVISIYFCHWAKYSSPGGNKLWLWVKSGQLLAFRNKLLLQHIHAHLFIIVHRCFCTTMAELSSCDRDQRFANIFAKPKIFII